MAAAAFVPVMVVVTVAAAGLAMLVDVLVIMSMAVAGGFAVLCERAGNEGLDAGIAAALGARIDRDAGLGKRVDSAAADTAANERVNATVGKQARQGAVAGATGAYDLLVEHLAILDVVDLELLAAAKVHKDVAVVVRCCHPHGADLLCWPCGRRRGDGEYAMLPPSMTIARPLTSAFATLRCARLLIAATVARAIPMCRATAS